VRKYIFFLKCSSVAVKVAAWIFLFLGIIGAVTLFSGASQDNPRWMGAVILIFYSFLFGLLFLIAKIADILVQIISATDESACGENTIQKD
jgi:hypothetical protein